MPTPVKRKQPTKVTNEAFRVAMEKRAKSSPLVVTGITPGKFVTIEPREFGRLDVDPEYQRGQTHEVGEIVRALQAGGAVLDPVTLVRRPWDTDTHKLWIVDGFQRVCALQQVRLPIQAMVHESESLDAEKKFFLALNSKRSLSADLIAKSWVGPAGGLLRSANTDDLHPLRDRINFQQGTQRKKIGATTLSVGVLTAVTGRITSGTAQRVLQWLDFSLEQNRMNRARAEHFLVLIGHLFPQTGIPIPVIRAYGLVAYERWQSDVVLPSRSVLDRLRTLDFKGATAGVTVEKFRPVYVEMIKRIWK